LWCPRLEAHRADGGHRGSWNRDPVGPLGDERKKKAQAVTCTTAPPSVSRGAVGVICEVAHAELPHGLIEITDGLGGAGSPRALAGAPIALLRQSCCNPVLWR